MIGTGLPPKADRALRRLLDGNEQYLSGNRKVKENTERIHRIKRGLDTYAVVVTCSDIPLEDIFSTEIGELFIIRTAGNTVSQMELNRVDYALSLLCPSLILVLGFTKVCQENASLPGDSQAPDFDNQEEKGWGLESVRSSMMLLKKSTFLARMKKAGFAALVGGLYDSETGEVMIHCCDN